MCHLLIATEIGSLHGTLRCYHTGEDIGIELVADAVPEEFLAGVYQSVDIAQTNPATQVP